MKTTKLCALLLASILAQIGTARAADLFLANVRGTCKQIGANDKIVSVRFDNNSIIQDYLATQDPAPDPRDLKVVYDPDGDRIAIVNLEGTNLLNVFTFDFSTTAADSLDAKRTRHVFLFPENATDSTGTAILNERIVRDGESNITKISMQGTLQFANSGTETNLAQVCTGTFSVGKKLVLRTPPEEPPTEP